MVIYKISIIMQDNFSSFGKKFCGHAYIELERSTT